MLGDRTRGRRMVGTDGSTELSQTWQYFVEVTREGSIGDPRKALTPLTTFSIERYFHLEVFLRNIFLSFLH